MTPHEVEVRGPRDSAQVYWVGHSLMNGIDEAVPDSKNVMELVGALAQSRSQSYGHYDHTNWGAPLHYNWRGNNPGDERDDSKARADRGYLSEHGRDYDVFVFTEVVPIDEALGWADSTYYLRKFYCEALAQNPHAEVFVYTTWNNTQPSAPGALDFEAQLRSNRDYWEQLADDSLGNRVPNPGRLGRLLSRVGIREKHCAPTKAFRFIPGGAAMLALSARLSELGERGPRLDDGRLLTMSELFANPYTNWDEARLDAQSTLALRHPSREHDDIHLSAVGSYFVALVSYAAIYRADPSGLPNFDYLPEDGALLLQQVAWRAVIDDPRSGVSPPGGA